MSSEDPCLQIIRRWGWSLQHAKYPGDMLAQPARVKRRRLARSGAQLSKNFGFRSMNATVTTTMSVRRSTSTQLLIIGVHTAALTRRVYLKHV